MNASSIISTRLAECAAAHAARSGDRDGEVAYRSTVTEARWVITMVLASTTVTVVYDKPDIEELGGVTYALHDAAIAIGHATAIAHAWSHCGWLRRGASSDLDGSGLCAWGDSQPGGWSVCDGDGHSTGRITCAARSGGIAVRAADGGTHAVLSLAQILGLSDADMALVDEHIDVTPAVMALAERIESVCDAGRPHVAEPSADDVWYALGPKRRTIKIGDTVRAGRPWGGSQIVVVAQGRDGKRITYMESEGWESAVQVAVAADAVAQIQSEIDREV